MSLNRATGVPRLPTPPRGEQIAAYDTYLEAQRAVDHLSDKEFPVENVTIVGTDLRMVERVTGRLTYSRVALAGAASGAWFGLFVGLLLSLFSSPDGVLPIFPAIAIGAAFGILFSVISYAFTRGRRDFTSASQIVASAYSVLCVSEHAHRARAILTEPGAPGLGRAARGPAAATAPTVPTPQAPVPPTQPVPPTGPGERPTAPPHQPTAPPSEQIGDSPATGVGTEPPPSPPSDPDRP